MWGRDDRVEQAHASDLQENFDVPVTAIVPDPTLNAATVEMIPYHSTLLPEVK